MIAPIVFIILLIAGSYLSELTFKTICIYLTLALIAAAIVYLMKWDPVIWFAVTAFLDAILVIHIFKGDINIRRY